jgi:PST family polysaccharide transporter
MIEGDDAANLHGKVARGLTWTFIHTWGRQLLNLAIFVILARLLVPDDFGLVALAAVFVNLAQLVVDQGLGDALIQRRELSQRHIDTAFWVAVATGLSLVTAGVLLAYPIAALLGEPELRPILQALSVTFLLSALGSIQIALLRRRLNFRALALRALGGIAGGGAVGVAMALLGFGVWSLVGQQIAGAAVSLVLLWSFSPWRPGRDVSWATFRELFRFGINVLGSDILGFMSRNVDNLLIGAFLGTTPLGFYAVGYRILDVTEVMLVNVARKVTFPAFSRLQSDPDRMRRAYLRVTRAAGAVILPGYIGLALVSTELTVTLFGQRWAESGPVAGILFLIGPVLTLQAFSGALLNAAGHPSVVFRFRLITTVVNVIGFLIAVQVGILAVAAAFVARGYLLVPLNLAWVSRYAGVPARAVLVQMRGVALASAAMVLAVVGVKLAFGAASPATLLAIEVVAGALAFVAAMFVVERDVLRELLALGRRAAFRTPAGAR